LAKAKKVCAQNNVIFYLCYIPNTYLNKKELDLTQVMADQTYKRLEFDQHGKPADVLHFKTITGIPTPKDDEVVIKVSASPVHPSVLMSIQGKIF
jgi:hypothetical protein